LGARFGSSLTQPFEASLDGIPGATVKVESGAVHAVQVRLDQPYTVEDVLQA